MDLFAKHKNKLKAVYEDDLIGYLKSVGVYQDILEGKYLCKYCGSKITLENLEIMVPEEREIKFICDNKNCLNQL